MHNYIIAFLIIIEISVFVLISFKKIYKVKKNLFNFLSFFVVLCFQFLLIQRLFVFKIWAFHDQSERIMIYEYNLNNINKNNYKKNGEYHKKKKDDIFPFYIK